MSVAPWVLLILWRSLGEVADRMFLNDDALELAIWGHQDLNVMVIAFREIDLDELDLVGRIDGADATAADVGEWEETARDGSGRGIVERAVNDLLALYNDRSFDQHFSILGAFGGFDTLHHLNSFLEFS